MKKISTYIMIVILVLLLNINIASAHEVHIPIIDRVRVANEEGEYLKGTFALKTINKSTLIYYKQVDCADWNSSGIGCNEIGTSSTENEMLENAIKTAILDDFASIKTVEEAAQKLNVPCETENTSDTNYCDSHQVYKDIYYPMIVEQITAEKGYAKGPRLIALIKAEINISDTKATASRKNVYLYNDVLDGYYTYDQEYDYANMYSLTDDEIAQFKSEYYVGLINEGEDFHTVPNSIAMPHLEIDNYIDGDSTTTIKKGEQAKYKVVIKNTGNTDYTNNVITSTIPDELNYVPGSASNNGVYNANNRTVTWNIDLLSPESTRELTYRVEANSNITDTREIEMRSIIKNSENPTGTVTTPVLVKTSKNVTDIATSPKTGALLSIIMLLSSLVIVGFLTIKYFKKQQNN